MKKTIKFFSRTPTADSTKQFSAVQTTNEYTETTDAPAMTDKPAVAQNSTDVNGIAELAAKVEALTSIVEKLAVNQGLAATMPDAPTVHPQAVAQNSETVNGITEVVAAVADKAPEADAAVNQPLAAEKANAEAEVAAVAQASNEPDTADDGNDKPEGIPEGNLGAEVPANEGKPYTDIPEDDIVKQFSKTANMEPSEVANLGLAGKETFGCLFA